MRDEFILGAGQSHHLEHAFRRGNWSTDEVNTLGSGDTLRDVREVVRGFSEIKPIQYRFDAAIMPATPEGLMVKNHKGHDKPSILVRRNDELYLNDRRIILKDVQEATKRGHYTFENLLAEPEGINATVMQFLEKMPRQFIPWPDYIRHIYFPATVFLGDRMQTHVGSFGFHQEKRVWKTKYEAGSYWLNAHFSRVAVLES